MRALKLTNPPALAHKSTPMNTGRVSMKRAPAKRVMGGVVLMLASCAASGCVTVNAPNDAIVIELNINITQEVIYRLAADAGNTIDENADIF